jgi:uncharacterized membrane protein YfcA
MHAAVGTSLATVAVTSLFSLRAHLKRNNVDSALVRQWASAILIGVLSGAALASSVRGTMLIAVFATVSCIVAIYMGFGNARHVVDQSLPRGVGNHAMASTIGLFLSMMGIGGGTLRVPVLTLFGFPMHRAVGSSSALGLIIGVPGVVIFMISGLAVHGLPPYSLGYANLLALAMILPTSMYFAPIGARVAQKLSASRLRQTFALFLAVTSIRMFYSILA